MRRFLRLFVMVLVCLSLATVAFAAGSKEKGKEAPYTMKGQPVR